MRGLENDVYFRVGLLTVIGLSAKNAILIVEFANELNQKGEDLLTATLSACRQRLRPILMTSLAFIFGVLPMATSTGAGSGSQHAVGTGVMGDDFSHGAGNLLRTAVFRAGASSLPAQGTATIIRMRLAICRRGQITEKATGCVAFLMWSLQLHYYSACEIAMLLLRKSIYEACLR